MWSNMEGVYASINELTTIHLRELPPPGNIMQIKMHVSKKALEESFFRGGWGFWHMNNSREDIFEAGKAFIVWTSESRFITSQSEI